jgi:hypothetical protein
VPIWLIIILAVLVLLAVGGFVARRRQLQQTEGVFRERLEKVNEQLAAAHASDRGWDPQLVRDAAGRLFAEQRGHEPRHLELWQVVDRPGTDEDKIVFHVDAELITLGRREGEWVFESLERADHDVLPAAE